MSDLAEKLSKKNKAPTISKLILSSDQLAQLLSMADADRAARSPIPADISPLPADRVLTDMLDANGWLSSGDENDAMNLNATAQQALAGVLEPQTFVQLVLGSPKEMAVTHLYSPYGYTDDSLTIYTFRETEGMHVIDPCHSPSDVSDALLAQLLNGPHQDGMNFDLSLEADQYLTYLAVLDLVYSRQLEAKLQAASFPALNFNAEDIWYRFSELRLGEDLLWSSVLIPYLFPNLDPKLTQKKVSSMLAILAEAGLISAVSKQVYQPSDFTLALAEGLLPIISFGACTITDADDRGMQTGFVIGLNVNLVIHTSEQGDVKNLHLTGMDGIQLSRLLFEIGLPAPSGESEQEG